jgi:hypothetical protein
VLIPKTLISKALTTVASATSYTNVSSSYRTIVTSVILTGQSAGTVTRKVTLYKGGTSAGDERINIDIDPTGVVYPKTVTIDTPMVLTSTQAIYVKQDAGADINIEVSGTEEDIT